MMNIAIEQKQAEINAAEHELQALHEAKAQLEAQITACEAKKALREQELAYLQSLGSNPAAMLQQWQDSLVAMQKSGMFAFPWFPVAKR